ncbi:MAG: NAD(P)H-dependent oxidoreductase subunit E [Deltaproteobacteria bacterium]|nr:NAD(P)H-dependent oxidoreductase subunit E [Deltaproteobacteria bacterium]
MANATLAHILEGRRSQPQQLIEVLQDIQEYHGYISEDSMRSVSDELGVPLTEVYSVASFYKAFSLKPRGENVLTVCTGTACHVRGAKMVLNQATGQLGVEPGETTGDGLFTVEHVNCLGACALGPVVTENGSCHHHMNPGKLRKLITSLRSNSTEGGSHDTTEKALNPPSSCAAEPGARLPAPKTSFRQSKTNW